jgi:hypothetical protein
MRPDRSADDWIIDSRSFDMALLDSTNPDRAGGVTPRHRRPSSRPTPTEPAT